MHEPPKSESLDVKALWRDQAPEEMPASASDGLAQYGRRLHAMTRSEILGSVIAMLFFAAVIVWRVGANQVKAASLVVMMVWVAITLIWLRKRVWESRSDAFAASCVEFYRSELEYRRKHLRNAWLWHGPLFSGCLAGVAIGTGTVAYKRFAEVAPLVITLMVWTFFSIRRRRREVEEIQRELDEMAEAGGTSE